MENTPGIVVSRPPEQTARILGAGIEVWEVAKAYFEVGQDVEQLAIALDFLTSDQIDAALDFTRKHWPAIRARIEEDYARVPENLRAGIPDLPA